METWPRYRARTHHRFATELLAYKQQSERTVAEQGGEFAPFRYSRKNLESFALSQLRGMSSVEIENQRGASKGDESTVLKGIKTAARLLGWTSPLRSGYFVPKSHQ